MTRRPAPQLADIELLDDAALIHDDEAVAEMRDNREVVADQDEAQPPARAQIAQQVENLGLHRDVERRGRLVEKEQARLENEGAGDRHALRWPPDSWCG